MKILLQHKILLGYIGFIAIICSMVAIILHERNRVQNIEAESVTIYHIQRNINAAHRYITTLATYGESVISWDEEDSIIYREQRLRTDSLLQILQEQCENLIPPEQIDTLCMLLLNKEDHLLQIMNTFKQQKKADSLLLSQLPTVTEKVSQPRTITRKKKGIAGFFGAKETIQILPDITQLNTLNEELLSQQAEQQEVIDAYTDSLRNHNKQLNCKLLTLMQAINNQTACVIDTKIQHLKVSHDRSVRIMTILVISAIILLLISYLIIQRDIRTKAKYDKRMAATVKDLQNNISENRRLIEARRRIMQTITHELRTPLAAIIGNAELIENDRKADRLRHLASIRQSAGRMSSLLDNLMNFFRLDNGKEQTDPKPFHLRSIADTLHTEFAPQAEAKQLMFQVKNCDDEVVVGDKNMILRIGSNLLSNAVKFTEQGTITISIFYLNNIFTMKVEDTGSGISEEQQERIYRPFVRLTNAATQDGFGLGLAIVRELVELMKGELSLKSVPGKGSLFCVSLPLERAEEATFHKNNMSVPQQLYGVSVLVLDNDVVLLSMTRDMLMRQKIDCDICRNVRELLEKIRLRNYDLLITDLKMPDINGYEVMELLRNSDIGNSRSIPIIVSTAMDKSAETELLAAGFCGCLFKPFSSDEAAYAISSCIGNLNQRQKIDLSVLLAYGDKTGTLERLIIETKKEMAQLQEACKKRDITGLDTMIHHLRSSWMLFNADRPLRELYDLIHNVQYDEISLDGKVQAVLENGAYIIHLAQKAKEDLWEK